ncbi:MAG TPA: cobalt ECF transporter T component CbiQ [Oscillospiraceae bacterium]|nr:cobalt ECF transporter T component CbiQ [Oscillospiraceae bacterium]
MSMDSNIPGWLLEKSEPIAEKPSRSKMHFMRKTIKHIAEVFENELVSEKYAGLPMLLQIIDPRVKLLIFLFFMVLSSFAANLLILVILAVIPLIYAKLSGIQLKSYGKRIWLTVPLVVFLFSIPGATNLFVQGTPLFYVLQPGALGLKSGLYFSLNGISTAFRLALRTGVSLSFGFLLLLTTRWCHITGALAAMHVPLVFISVLNMAYRYIFVMSAAAGDMMDARLLRTTGNLSTKENRRFMGHSIGHLFLKSHYMSEEIYDAMCCRGFTGKPVSLSQFKMESKDFLFLANNSIIAVILIVGERLF